MPEASARSFTRNLVSTVPVAVTGALAVTFVAPAAANADVAPASSYPRLSTAVAQQAVAALHNVRVAQPATARVAPAAAAPAVHLVAPGDTVSAIAIKNGLRTVDLLSWNGLGWSDTIYPGQKLALSAGSASGAAPSATKPSSSASAMDNGITGEAGTLTHVVVAGDTVTGIGAKYRVSVARILNLNSLDASAIIYPGQKLLVATNQTSTSTPDPQEQAPKQEAPQQSPEPAPAPGEGSTYTVKAGDTLWSIAQKHGVSLSELLAANGLSGDSIIYPGQTLVIPGEGSSPAPQEVPQEQESNDPPSQYDSPDDQLSAELNAPQAENATMIIRIGRELGVSDKGIAIALATAMVESGVRNLDWGDRDSLGLFQQRPSTGWGTEEQILDRNHAIRAFFGGPSDPNGSATRGLLDIPGWESMEFGEAAQTVQISAFPDRYGRWETAAYGWLAQFG